MKVCAFVAKEIEIEIDDKFMALDVPINETPNVPDSFYEECLEAAQCAVNDIDPTLEVNGVYATESKNMLAEQ